MRSATRSSLALLLGVSLTACAPIYLHDPAGEAAATAARTAFQETLAKGRLADLLGSYRAQSAEQNAATLALQNDDVRNQIYSFSAKPWLEIVKDTEDELSRTQQAIDLAKDELSGIEQPLADSLQAREDAASRVNDLVAALNRAADAERRYTATQKLLAAGLQAIVRSQGGAATGRQALEAVLKTKVKGRSFTDAEGLLVETPDEEKSVGEVLKIDPGLFRPIDGAGDPRQTLQALLKGVHGLGNFQGLQVGDPGIAVTIVGLGYDVARAEERRLAATIDEAQRTHGLYREQLTFLDTHKKRLDRNLMLAKGLEQADPGLKNETVEGAIRRLQAGAAGAGDIAEQQKRRKALIAFHRQIGDNVQFRVVDAQIRSDFQNAVEALKTEQALALAEVNLREREAVIIRGLDGLVAFQQGGIDADDVRNLILLAQAFGVFAIAAK